jgi:hypothetical protein
MSDPVMGALLLQEEWIDRRLRHLAVSHRRELCALADAILAIAVVIKASSATTVLYTRAAEIGTCTLRLDIFQFTQQNLLTLFQITMFCPVCGGST